jgi:hypothetical protein
MDKRPRQQPEQHPLDGSPYLANVWHHDRGDHYLLVARSASCRPSRKKFGQPGAREWISALLSCLTMRDRPIFYRISRNWPSESSTPGDRSMA